MSDARNSSKGRKDREARLVVGALGAIAALLFVLVLLIPAASHSFSSSVENGGNSQSSRPARPGVPPTGNASVSEPVASSNGARGGESHVAPHGSSGSLPATSVGTHPGIRDRTHRLYLVIDDVGNNTFQLRPFLKFPGPLTIAILPQVEYSAQAAKLAHDSGKEVILHLPMEADSATENPGPGAILVNMPDQAIAVTLKQDIASVPYLIGVNNHMGSRATADTRVMQVVLAQLKGDGLFFLDSKTTPYSVADRIAKRLGLPFAEREVFLDNEQTTQSILEEFHTAERIATERGYAVLIGHVWTESLARIIIELYPELLDRGFEFGKLSDLMRTGAKIADSSGPAGGPDGNSHADPRN